MTDTVLAYVEREQVGAEDLHETDQISDRTGGGSGGAGFLQVRGDGRQIAEQTSRRPM